MTASHECLAPGCYRAVPVSRIGCSTHQPLIHEETKRALDRALRSGNTTKHAAALRDAVEDMGGAA